MATKSTALSIFMVCVLVFHIKMTASAFQGSENLNSHWNPASADLCSHHLTSVNLHWYKWLNCSEIGLYHF